MKVLEAVGATRAAPCGVVCAASLSLMYSSMHPLKGRVNRVERTLLNFFMRRGVRGGFFRVLGQCFAGDFGVAARRGWAVLPRNSGVFGLVEGAARRFSARRTLPGSRGEKIFKKGAKNPKIGVREVPEGDLRAPYIGWAGRFLGLGTQPLAALLGVRFVQVHQLRAPAMRSQSFAPLIYGAPVCKLHRSLYRGISACPTRNSLTFTCGLRLPACRMLGYDHILSK